MGAECVHNRRTRGLHKCSDSLTYTHYTHDTHVRSHYPVNVSASEQHCYQARKFTRFWEPLVTMQLPPELDTYAQVVTRP